MRFRKGNRIPYFQDMCFFRGLPTGVEFAVQPDIRADCFHLTADGYGGKPGGDAYGNGRLIVPGLTARQRGRFERACDPESLAAARERRAKALDAAIADLKARAKRLGVKVTILKPGEEKEDG